MEMTTIGPAKETSVLIAYEKKPSNAHADISSEAGLCLHLHLYFVYASNEGSNESTHLRRPTSAGVAR